MQDDTRLAPNSHLHYHDGSMTGQNLVGKGGVYGYGAGPLWSLSATGELQRQTSVFDGSEFDTNASSCSPKSYFSDPSDAGQVLGPGDMANDPVSFDSQQTQQTHARDLGTVPTVELNSGSVLWPSPFPARPGLPYYQPRLGPMNSFHQSMNSSLFPYPAQVSSDALYLSHGSETRHGDSRPDHYQAGRTAETQAQRDEDNRLLIEGKAQGLTYKQIRDKMQSPIAESTLRGRYRSLVKPRKDRVRKPIWKEKDVSS